MLEPTLLHSDGNYNIGREGGKLEVTCENPRLQIRPGGNRMSPGRQYKAASLFQEIASMHEHTQILATGQCWAVEMVTHVGKAGRLTMPDNAGLIHRTVDASKSWCLLRVN